MTPVVQLESVSRTYFVGPAAVGALREVSLRVAPGEFVAISGPSGSGKSTLLNVLGLLDRPDRGVYRLDGRDTAVIRDDELTVLRSRKIGFIFQNSPMLPRLTAAENVAVPLLYRGRRPGEAQLEAHRMLARVGLESCADQLPAQLSGGQLQRVGIARALIGQPRLLLADEPTAALDAETAGAMFNLVVDTARQTRAALLMITHELPEAARADRHLALDAGRLGPARAAPAPIGGNAPVAP